MQGDPESEANVIDVKSSEATLRNLYAFCDYEMQVCAYNAMGEGAYSDVIHCRTLEDGEHSLCRNKLASICLQFMELQAPDCFAPSWSNLASWLLPLQFLVSLVAWLSMWCLPP